MGWVSCRGCTQHFPGFGRLGAELLGLAKWGRMERRARTPGRAGDLLLRVVLGVFIKTYWLV